MVRIEKQKWRVIEEDIYGELWSSKKFLIIDFGHIDFILSEKKGINYRSSIRWGLVGGLFLLAKSF